MSQEILPKKAGPAQAVTIILINMLPMIAIVALMPIVPAISENFKDIPNITTWAPLVLSAPGLCIALVSPYAGYLTDKFGRRNLLIITMLLYGAGGIVPFFVKSFPALMGGRLLLGVGEAFIMTIANVLLGYYFSPSLRTRWLMIQGIVGAILGTSLLSLSGYMAQIGWQYPFLVYSIAFVCAIAAWFFIFEPPLSEHRKQKKYDTKIPLGLITKLCSVTVIASTIYFVYTLQFSLALDAIGIKDRSQLGNISALVSVAVPLGALCFKFFSNRPIRLQLLIISVLIGSGLAGIGFSATKASIMSFAFIQQLGCGMTMPVLIAWGLNILPPEFRGRGMGFWSSAFFLGQFISPLVVTAVRLVSGSLLSAFVVFGAVCLVLGVVNYLLSKNKMNTITGNTVAH